MFYFFNIILAQSDLDGELIKRYKDENWAMWSLQRGLQQLPEALEKYLGEQSNVSTMTDTSCQKLEFHDGKAKVCLFKNHFEAIYYLPQHCELLYFKHKLVYRNI